MESLDQMAVQVHNSGLSDDEKHAFDEVKDRAQTGDYDVTGKTVGQLIGDQLAYDADQKAQAAKAAALAEQIRERHEAQVRALKNALTIAMVGKGFQPADWSNFEYDSFITMEFALHNNSQKTIRAVKGTTIFRNSLGDQIYSTHLEYEQPIQPGHTDLYDGTLKYNEYDSSLSSLKDADSKNVHLDWQPQLIIFTDGSRLEVTQ